MKLSDQIAQAILSILEQEQGVAEIQRNELAGLIGCVPSQINYVLTSRFTPEQGFLVESRRGGGGYIRITRVQTGRTQALMHAVNAIGGAIDAATARIFLDNLSQGGLISPGAARLMSAATAENCLREVEAEKRDAVRAAIFKSMMLAYAAMD